jgi:O-antigen/teichoic acid export membrane protein
MLCGLRGAGDHRRFVKALWANLLLNVGVTIAASIPIILLSPWIMAAYGEGFREDWDILAILVGTSVIYAVLHIESQVTACMGKLWWDFGMHLAWAIALLAGSALLVPTYGVRGYAWAYAGSFAVHAVLNGIAAAVLVRQARLAASEPSSETPG